MGIVVSILIAAVALLAGAVWSLDRKLKGVMAFLALTSGDKIKDIEKKMGISHD